QRSALARVMSIDGKGVTVETASKQVLTLQHGDAMLSRLDLGYSLNMHMAQGVTADKGIMALSSAETNLTNQQLFNVGVTRVRSDLTVVVNDQEKVSRQLDRNTGIKTSALETVGRINIDGPGSSGSPSTGTGSKTSSGPSMSFSLSSSDLGSLPPLPRFDEKDAARYAKGGDDMGLSKKPDDMGLGDAGKGAKGPPVPEKNLGLEL
ncbi:AAA family ATPase, partial [Sphingomonas sp. ABOLE]